MLLSLRSHVLWFYLTVFSITSTVKLFPVRRHPTLQRKMRFLAPQGATIFSNVRQSIPVRFFIRTLYSSKGSLPRRSFLYIPGNDERKVFKAKDLNADCVVLDCEDGVAANKKEEARSTIHGLLGQVNFGSCEVCVRINSIETGLADDDLRLALTAKALPHSIVVPKVETVEHINWISEKVAAHIKTRGQRIGLIAQVESALSLLNLSDVCEQGVSEERPFSLEALVFGSDDFLASIGATRTQDANELTYARQSVVVHAKAYGLQAIDMVYINFKDPEGLRVQAEEGARFGYTGKQIIHPSQIEIVNKAFSPSEERIKWAAGLVNAFEEQEKAGKGAIDFHGSMIDMPTVQQARNVLRLANATKVQSH